MKNARKLMPLVLMVVLSLSRTGCGGAEKKPTPPESLTKTNIEVLIEEGCNPISEAHPLPLSETPQWACDEEALLKLGELCIRLQERVVSLEDDIKYYDRKLDLKEDFYEAKLNQWYRRWYVTLPLGFLAGGLFSLTLALAL